MQSDQDDHHGVHNLHHSQGDHRIDEYLSDTLLVLLKTIVILLAGAAPNLPESSFNIDMSDNHRALGNQPHYQDHLRHHVMEDHSHVRAQDLLGHHLAAGHEMEVKESDSTSTISAALHQIT